MDTIELSTRTQKNYMCVVSSMIYQHLDNFNLVRPQKKQHNFTSP